MKTLEERLMNNAVTMYSFLDGRDRFVRLDDALAIVADAPRIYRGEEIRDAPDGDYVMMYGGSWEEVDTNDFCRKLGGLHLYTFFGPLPTNSPSEGKG